MTDEEIRKTMREESARDAMLEYGVVQIIRSDGDTTLAEFLAVHARYEEFYGQNKCLHCRFLKMCALYPQMRGYVQMVIENNLIEPTMTLRDYLSITIN